MYIVILGAGRVGGLLARRMVIADHEVAVIDRDAARCSALEDELGSVAVIGDGTEASTLAKAGTNRADVFIATTGRDETNLAACQLARHRFEALHTASLVNIDDHDSLFKILGIDLTINATNLLVDRIHGELSTLLVEEIGSLG